MSNIYFEWKILLPFDELFRNGILSRLLESMITSRFYNVTEKYSASDLKKPFFQWFKTKPSVEIKNYNVMIDWPASKKII